MRKENHITYTDKISGIIFVPDKQVFKMSKLEVRYSKSNIDDSISFSDNKSFMVQFRTKDLRKLLEKYEDEDE